jgi:hypothetical protein
MSHRPSHSWSSLLNLGVSGQSSQASKPYRWTGQLTLDQAESLLTVGKRASCAVRGFSRGLCAECVQQCGPDSRHLPKMDQLMLSGTFSIAASYQYDPRKSWTLLEEQSTFPFQKDYVGHKFVLTDGARIPVAHCCRGYDLSSYQASDAFALGSDGQGQRVRTFRNKA